MKIVVLDGHALNPGDLTWDALKAVGDLQVFDRTADDQILARAHDSEIVMTNKTRLPGQVLKQLTKIPTYGTDSVAQFTFAMLLELCHHVAVHAEATRAGEWSRSEDFSFWKTPLIELAGKTIGLIGLGQIGRRVAEIALALKMRVVAADAVRSPVP